MRKLYYVPIIHTSADLGVIGGEAARRGVERLGEDVWTKHVETVSGFWQALEDYFSAFDAAGVRVYQDGMMADGELGEKIVKEGAEKGSKNFMIILDLLKRGAVLMKTEDLDLLRKEYTLLLEISKAARPVKKLLSYLKYRLIKDRLLKKRDRYIAGMINGTLKDRETGVLFVGAYHDVHPGLSDDIQVVELKDMKKVRDYQDKFIHPERCKDEVATLSRYLVSPVETIPMKSRETG
ncbi:MAG TPA: hypothetical protein VI728_14460 [Syntrophales bacterium]|nr:MAG: hypothetical protein A2052_05785 [Deltaproteobacteria bacterium GWA2_54_12]HLE19475.1 hypothetical protein [Syntrophales bacterium]